jgi:catechol 2,3-dioxygenase-like lactoylglutathione lyase family enzyme
VDQAVTFITLGVADLAVSRRFYVDGLGWEPLFEVPGGITFFQVGHGVVLGIWGLEALGGDAGAPATPGTPFALASNVGSVEEVDAAVGRARAAGATVLREPAWHEAIGIYHAYVADPDGHRWEIAFNPGMSVADDGTVSLGPPP